VDDDRRAFGHAVEDLRGEAVAVADGERCETRAAGVQREHRPAVVVAEQRTGGDLQHVAAFPEDEARLHAVTVTETRP